MTESSFYRALLKLNDNWDIEGVSLDLSSNKIEVRLKLRVANSSYHTPFKYQRRKHINRNLSCISKIKYHSQKDADLSHHTPVNYQTKEG